MENTIIAHRGLHNEVIPENSLLSFKNAIKKGYPIELDVHILKDKKIVVFHDDNLKRMTGVDKKIKECSFSEIRNLLLKDSDEKIPTLEEVLNLVKGEVPLVIEFKTDVLDHSLEKEVLRFLRDYKGEVLLKSFSYKIVKFLKKNCNYKVGFLYSNIEKKKKRYNFIKRYIYKHINFNIFIKPDFISCDYHVLKNKNIKKFQKQGGEVFAWTIKSKEDLEKYKDKCDALIVENII